jgi:hypothetical protein
MKALKVMGQTLVTLILLSTFGQMALTQSAPTAPQGQHLTKKHRTRYVTGKPLFSVPVENNTRIITYTPEDMHELVVQNRDVEKVSFHDANLAD